MTTTNFFPAGTPDSIGNLIQQNALTRVVGEALRPSARYREDARREELAMGTGATASFHRLGLLDVDLKPAPVTGAPDYGQFEAERYSAQPIPYAKSANIGGLQNYAQVGNNLVLQTMTRLAEWAGRTGSRLARGRLLHHLGGQSIVRTQGGSSDSTLVVNSLAGFRFKHVNGVPTAVSGSNKLPITIVAGSTITTKSVTGVTPLNNDYPDGPGTLTLDATLGATVVVQSYVYVQGATTTTPRTFVRRPNSKLSTEALLATDLPTLADVVAMKAKLVGRGVPPHSSTGTYHLHVDETFLAGAVADTAWRQAFQGAGLSPLLGAGAFYIPMYGITLIENNDSPASGRGAEVAVGATPASSASMQDVGFDVISSTNVKIRRAVMTGEEVLIESFVDPRKLIMMNGARPIHEFGDVSVMDLNGSRFIAANINGWLLTYRPPLDERALASTATVWNVLDFVLPTDVNSGTDTTSGAPLKRAVWLEYGSDS